jgi:hypothetical protein
MLSAAENQTSLSTFDLQIYRCLSLSCQKALPYQTDFAIQHCISRPRLCRNQPVTSIVEALLLSGQPVGNDIWIALAWCVRIMLMAYLLR